MNDDTKEILEGIASGKYDSGVIYDIDIKALLDYINDLKDENKHLDEVNCKLRKGGEALKDTNKLLLQQKEQLQEDLDIIITIKERKY